MAKAVILSSKENRLETLKKELESRGIETVIIERETVADKEFLEAKAQGLGKVDYLVVSSLCDEKFRGRTLHELTTEEYLEWKYYALIQFYEINRSFVKKMVDNGGGVVIGVLSSAGAVPAKGECMNGMAGAALYMGIQCIAEESHGEGIYANAVAVGALEDNEDIRPMVNNTTMVEHLPAGKLMVKEAVCKNIVDIMQSTNEVMTGNLVNLDGAFACAYMREW